MERDSYCSIEMLSGFLRGVPEFVYGESFRQLIRRDKVTRTSGRSQPISVHKTPDASVAIGFGQGMHRGDDLIVARSPSCCFWFAVEDVAYVGPSDPHEIDVWFDVAGKPSSHGDPWSI